MRGFSQCFAVNVDAELAVGWTVGLGGNVTAFVGINSVLCTRYPDDLDYIRWGNMLRELLPHIN